MMPIAISKGLIILLLYLQIIHAQQGVSNNVVKNAALSQQRTTCNSGAGINFNQPQPGQQINWQQQSNMQQDPVSQQYQAFQPAGMNSQVLQNQNPMADIFSALSNLRFAPQTPQGVNQASASTGYSEQISPQLQNNPQYSKQAPETSKPSYTFQFVPASQNKAENQNAVPVQFLTSGQNQLSSQQGKGFFIQNQPTNMPNQQATNPQNFGSQPIVFTMSPQQTDLGQNSMVYTLQPTQQSSSSNQPQSAKQGPSKSDPMAYLMSQMQSSSGNPDISSILPMLMNSKSEKSSGMKAILPLIMNLLSDRSCGCPNCGCPYNENNEPTINGGYANQVNYSQQDLSKTPPKLGKSTRRADEESYETVVTRVPKKYKTKVIPISEEASYEEEDYDDDYED